MDDDKNRNKTIINKTSEQNKKEQKPLKLFYKEGIEVGIDEVGRGCLSGPVFAAAVILPKKFPDDIYLQIKDSKKLSHKKRLMLTEYIKKHALDYSIGIVKAKEIDEINILQASFKAMHNALDNLKKLVPENIIVDGHLFKPYFSIKNDDFITHTCIIEGDNKYFSIAAASILAKESRDEYMKNLCKKHPELKKYGWESNKGYATKKHREAILEYGITKYHRHTFGICKRVLQQYKNNFLKQTEKNSDDSE